MVVRASFWTYKILEGTLAPSVMPTAYLLLDGRCTFDCAYCTHARTSTTPPRFLSRVTWREIDPSKLMGLNKFERVCIQVVNYPGAHRDALELVKEIRANALDAVISVSTRVNSSSEIDDIMSYGVTDIGIAIDVADPSLHRKYRGGELGKTMKLLEYASSEYPGKVTTHVIVGLGETDEQLFELFKELKWMGVRVALFAFTPVPGTKLSATPPPSLERYRKIQVLRYLIFERGIEPTVTFDESGMIVGLHTLEPLAAPLQEASKTSGCPLCTRPFYNDRPSGLFLFNDHRLHFVK